MQPRAKRLQAILAPTNDMRAQSWSTGFSGLSPRRCSSASPWPGSARRRKACRGRASTPVGGETAIPYGWVDFCNRHAEECALGRLTPVDVHMTRQAWKTLNDVNAMANSAIEPISNLDHWGTTLDHWDYPVDGKGDCKIYALFKRKLLIERGFPRQALLMTIVRDLNGEGHAVLTVKTDRGDFVLDNLADDDPPLERDRLHLLQAPGAGRPERLAEPRRRDRRAARRGGEPVGPRLKARLGDRLALPPLQPGERARPQPEQDPGRRFRRGGKRTRVRLPGGTGWAGRLSGHLPARTDRLTRRDRPARTDRLKRRDRLARTDRQTAGSLQRRMGRPARWEDRPRAWKSPPRRKSPAGTTESRSPHPIRRRRRRPLIRSPLRRKNRHPANRQPRRTGRSRRPPQPPSSPAEPPRRGNPSNRRPIPLRRLRPRSRRRNGCAGRAEA